jgi:hypothetical protein
MARQSNPEAPAAATAAPPMPRSAAASGVVFALMFGAALVLVRLAVPDNIVQRGPWLSREAGSLQLAMHLLAYGGIAFLWFIGVVRTHLGTREDQFFATVALGSGLLFLAMTFTAAALTYALLGAHAQAGESLADSGVYAFGSRIVFELVNGYALRMAGVFMISLATLCLRTRAMPRAFAWATYALAAVLLLGLPQTLWASLVFPLWVLGFSVYLLLHRPAR